jgi:hypothetical protein
VIGVLGLAAGLAGPAAAQEAAKGAAKDDAAQGAHQVTLHVGAGGLHALAKLDRSGAWGTNSGVSVFGSAGIQLAENLVVRADVDWARSEIQFQGVDFGFHLSRIFATAIAQVQLPSGSLNKYLLVGGGAAFLNQHTSADPKQTVGTGIGGAGVAYQLGKSGVSLLAEGRVYLYQTRGVIGNQTGAPRVLWDASLGGGLSYAIGRF